MAVIGAGLVTVDIIQKTDSGWRPLDAEPVALSSGGTVCNILCHLAHAGWTAGVFGMVGPDAFGDLLLEDLERFGVNCAGLLRHTSDKTRRILHMIAVEGHEAGKHKFALKCSLCGQPFPPMQPPAVSELEPQVRTSFTDSTVLVIDRANEVTAYLVERARAAGGVVVFEPGYLSQRSTPYVERILSNVDVLKYSHELTWNGRPFSKAVRTAPQAPGRIVIETRGANGVRLARENRSKLLVAQPVADVRDGSGAGDAFMAGFLLGLGQARLANIKDLSDAEIEEAVARGQARGGLSCLYFGSKGLLYQHSHDAIDRAVDEFVSSLRAPQDFGSGHLRGSEFLLDGAPAACAVCGLSS